MLFRSLFCFFNAAENVDDTVTPAGRAIVAQDYPYTAPGAISATSTPHGDSTPQLSPARSRSWKPKLLTMGGSFSKTPQIKMQKKSRASRGSSKPKKKPDVLGTEYTGSDAPRSETPRGALGCPLEDAASPRRPSGEEEKLPGDVGDRKSVV